MGLYIDDLLNFGAHVNNIYRKAAREKTVLATLSGVLNVGWKLLLFYSSILLQFVQPSGTYAVGIKWGKWKNYKRELCDMYTEFQLIIRGIAW